MVDEPGRLLFGRVTEAQLAGGKRTGKMRGLPQWYRWYTGNLPFCGVVFNVRNTILGVFWSRLLSIENHEGIHRRHPAQKAPTLAASAPEEDQTHFAGSEGPRAKGD